MAQKKNEGTGKKRVVFTLNEPSASEVCIVGDFNGWSPSKHKMKEKQNGIWEKTIVVPSGRYEYKFVVNGEWQNDPGNDQLVPNTYGSMNNVLVV